MDLRLEQSQTVAPGNWTPVTNAITFDPTTLRDQVMLFEPATNAFYRLSSQ
jgi:hypothetical protein